jgi:GT2 family glycosyltransferase
MTSSLASRSATGTAGVPEVIRPHIYVVLPVFNRKGLLKRFLDCMRRQTFRNFTIIVVDDGSTDGTSALLRDQYGEVQLLMGDGNLWWTGGINCGIRHALAQAGEDDAVLVINDDVEVDSHYLESLYASWQRMPNTLIGSVGVDINDPGTIQDGGRLVNWWTAKARVLNSQKQLSDFPDDYQVDVSLLTGWGTLVPVKIFREIGLYDEKHFQQCGDTELPVRAKNRGYRLVVSYGAVIKIHAEQTAGINVSTRYSLKDLKTYFFGVKSNFRLKYRFFFCYDTARNPLAFVSYLTCDMLRITVHFLRGLRSGPRVSSP